MAFLDKTGLSYLWTQIVSKLGQKVDKSALGDAGITDISYIPCYGGQFTVTTANEEGYISPHAQVSVTENMVRGYDYRVTVNGTQYDLRCNSYFDKNSDQSVGPYTYIGNLTLYSTNLSGLIIGIDDVPFLIKNNSGVLDIFTSETSTVSILVEYKKQEGKVIPDYLIYGTNAAPIESECRSNVSSAISIGSNSVDSRLGVAIGWWNIVSDNYATAIGTGTTASGIVSLAEGSFTTASGHTSHAEGQLTIASGDYSHASGYNTIASAPCAHAEGDRTEASGYYAHSGGNNTKANGQSSFAHGSFVETTQPSQFVIGYGNNPQSDSIFEVGNGLRENGTPNNSGNVEPATRQNAFRVTQSGVAIAQTGLQIGSTSITEEQLQSLIALISENK